MNIKTDKIKSFPDSSQLPSQTIDICFKKTKTCERNFAFCILHFAFYDKAVRTHKSAASGYSQADFPHRKNVRRIFILYFILCAIYLVDIDLEAVLKLCGKNSERNEKSNGKNYRTYFC